MKRMLGAAVAAGAVLGGVLWARRHMLRWGASADEVGLTLPGDELLPQADLVATRAITIAAPVAKVWPWLVQLGQQRGGFYSYEALENLVGCRIRNASAIVPEWQTIAVGDEVLLAAAAPLRLAVAVVEPQRALVLRGALGPDGSPPPFDFIWAFVVEPLDAATTRLRVRERYAYSSRATALMVEPAAAISWLMSEKMLRGIRDRAEAT